MMQKECLSIRMHAVSIRTFKRHGKAAALICARFAADRQQPFGLRWEVYVAGEREPLRYGLCLTRPEDGFELRVPVQGLAVGVDYRFQLLLDEAVVGSGHFRTAATSAADVAA